MCPRIMSMRVIAVCAEAAGDVNFTCASSADPSGLPESPPDRGRAFGSDLPKLTPLVVLTALFRLPCLVDEVGLRRDRVDAAQRERWGLQSRTFRRCSTSHTTALRRLGVSARPRMPHAHAASGRPEAALPSSSANTNAQARSAAMEIALHALMIHSSACRITSEQTRSTHQSLWAGDMSSQWSRMQTAATKPGA